MPNKKNKRRGSSAVNFLKKMKSIPLPKDSVSMHGELRQEDALGKFLDRELLNGVCNPHPALRNPYNANVADISDLDWEALDEELASL